MLDRIFLSGQSVHSRSQFCSLQAFQPQNSPAAIRRKQSLTVENRVLIRFQRLGRKKLPFFRIVAIDSRRRRDGLPIERLGWYNPLSKETSLNAPAIKKWLKQGAKPTEATARILARAMVIDPDLSKADLA